MLTVGDVVTARVTSVQIFGVFCRCESHEILVLIPDISWIASFNSCDQFAEPGDELRVKIIRFNSDKNQWVGTLKGLYSDPWKTDQLTPGTTHLARVIRYVTKTDRCEGKPAYLMELVSGGYAMLCAHALDLKLGDQVPVMIQQSDPLRCAVKLAPMLGLSCER